MIFSVKIVDGKLTLSNEHPVPQSDANQENPKGFYVYVHCDAQGKIFYVGKGTGKRAWSKDRHPLWVRYVEKHLGGKYEIRILADKLSEEESEVIEAEFMAEYVDLINWQNMARTNDYEKAWQCLDRQKANQVLIQQAKATEKQNPESAVELYVNAIENVQGYDDRQYDTKTLLGRLEEEEERELRHCGKPEGLKALDRLTMCLIKLGRSREASERVEAYFTLYPRDRTQSAAKQIIRRIEKALSARGDREEDPD